MRIYSIHSFCDLDQNTWTVALCGHAINLNLHFIPILLSTAGKTFSNTKPPSALGQSRNWTRPFLFPFLTNVMLLRKNNLYYVCPFVGVFFLCIHVGTCAHMFGICVQSLMCTEGHMFTLHLIRDLKGPC